MNIFKRIWCLIMLEYHLSKRKRKNDIKEDKYHFEQAKLYYEKSFDKK